VACIAHWENELELWLSIQTTVLHRVLDSVTEKGHATSATSPFPFVTLCNGLTD